MRKVFTQPSYRKWHKNRLSKIERKRRKRRRVVAKSKAIRSKSKAQKNKSNDKTEPLKAIIYAPEDFRLIENPEEVLTFFEKLRSNDYVNAVEGSHPFIRMTLIDVKQIDYGAISILTAILDDMRFNKLNLYGDFPEEANCMEMIIHSGYMKHITITSGYQSRFVQKNNSELVYFEKGSGFLSIDAQTKISSLVKDVINHLNATEKHRLPIMTIIKEICGNSIEWGGANKLWLLGVQYVDNKVIFTVTDVGVGILNTLYFKFGSKFFNLFRSDVDILRGAFDQKYGSSSQEVNRNKGLPAIKDKAKSGIIENLKLITNNVILHFDNDELSKSLGNKISFKGTLYQWELSAFGINKISQDERTSN